MLNSIEAGADWPEEMNEARAAFMAKDEEDKLNPLAYRVLLMLPVVYRMWARARLAHLQPWIAKWATPEMLAGIEGQGAEEAAIITALVLEHCRMKRQEFTSGAADVYKFFDQAQRDLLFDVLETAGMPQGVLGAYRSFLEKWLSTRQFQVALAKRTRNQRAYPKGILFR